ncbi:MAG: GNAT family N-acetyltransferase [Clostridia bacterium]|nr:GNAT family N-acetyltransferase [Clostridia bacterium]
MRAEYKDAEALTELVGIIWHDTPEELTEIIRSYMASDDSAVFAEKANGEFIGVALCSLRRDYVEGCDTSPVGYLEGVSTREGYRGRGIARRLVAECEQWAREKGCTEFASDCELTNTASLDFHLHIGFSEENRIICFRKPL